MFLTTDFSKLTCTKCKKKYSFSVPFLATQEEMDIAYEFCRECREIIQPERSKREEVCSCMKIPHVAADCWNTGCGKEHIMRCSEHCGNTVRDK